MIELGDSSKNEVGVGAETASGLIGFKTDGRIFGVEFEANIRIDRCDDELTLTSSDITKFAVVDCFTNGSNQAPSTYILTAADKKEIAYLIHPEIERELADSSESVIEELDELDDE